MFNNKEIIKDFINNNLSMIIPYILVICIMLPLESVAFSKSNYRIIDSLKNGDLEMIKEPIIWICVIYIVGKLLAMIQEYYLLKINSKLNNIIREKLFEAYITRYSKKYEEVDISRIISKLNLLPKMYEEMIYDFLHTIMPYGITILVLCIYFFFIDKKLGIYLCISVLILFVIIIFFAKKCVMRELEKFMMYNDLNDSIQDKMFNIESIIFNNEVEGEIKDNIEKEENYSKFAVKNDLITFSYSFILNIYVFGLLIGGFFIYYGLFKKNIKDPKLLSSILVFFYLLKYINIVKWSLLEFISKIGILKTVNKEIDETGPVLIAGTKKEFINNGHIIIKDLAFKYNDKYVHKNLNLEFKPNEITTILGKSGSGKTTILKLIMGFYPYEGFIYYDGTELHNADVKYVRDNISIVNQTIKLFNKSMYENIKYSNENITNNDIDKLLKDMNIIILGDLNKKVGINGTEASNGQRQIIMILRAYFNNKQIMIYDEPTSALDKNTKTIIIDIIKSLSKNKTIIIVTHDNDLVNISDKIYELKIDSQ